jgi:hypothetical protein
VADSTRWTVIRGAARGKEPDRIHEEYRTARKEFLAALREVVAEHQGGSPADVEAECARLPDHLP